MASVTTTSRRTWTSSRSASTVGAPRWPPSRRCWASPRRFRSRRPTRCCTLRSQPDRQKRHKDHIRSAFDIRDVWPSSYSSNTNEILWGAKAAARIPWIACVVRMSSYECGMDQPTYTPVQQIIERSGTLFFSFQDLDSTKPSGSVKIRVETITHYLEKYAGDIIEKKKAAMGPGCPLLRRAAEAPTGAL